MRFCSLNPPGMWRFVWYRGAAEYFETGFTYLKSVVDFNAKENRFWTASYWFVCVALDRRQQIFSLPSHSCRWYDWSLYGIGTCFSHEEFEGICSLHGVYVRERQGWWKNQSRTPFIDAIEHQFQVTTSSPISAYPKSFCHRNRMMRTVEIGRFVRLSVV